MKPTDKCSHGKMYTEDCYDCDILWEEDSIKNWSELLEKSRNKLNMLYLKKARLEACIGKSK